MRRWLAVFALINGFLLAEWTLAGRNLPDRHPELVLEKSLYWTAPLGEGATQTRQLLAGNRLHLDVWQSFQEVNYGPFAELRELEVEFELQPEAYLLLTYQRDAGGRRGLRLSRHPRLPSVYFESDRTGRFVRSAALDAPLGLSNRVRLQGTRLLCNGSSFQLPAYGGPTLVSLGSGALPTTIDRLRINGQQQSFAHRRNLGRLGLVFGAVLLCLVPWLGRLQLGLTPVLLGLLLFDRSYWAGRYALHSNIERARIGWCDLWEGLDPTPTLDYRPIMKHLGQPERAMRRSLAPETYGSDGPVVLFLGTSQLWGSGAQRRDDRVVAQLAQMKQGYRLINGSRWGSNCAALEKRYRRELSAFRPALVVLDLGHNDQNNPEFAAQLETLVQSCRPARVVLLCEANTGELPLPPSLQQAHAIVRQTARRHQLVCLELDAWLRHPQRLSQGIMWCDLVHLTSYGQAEMAAWLAQGLPWPVQNKP
jgi:lysophospholipase L1-like esterase